MKAAYVSPRTVSLRLHTEGMMALSKTNEVSNQPQLSDEREDVGPSDEIWGSMED